MARPTKAQAQEIVERRKKAAQLRLAGVDWETVAAQCDYDSAASAITDLRRARQQSLAGLTESLTELRDRDLERLERLLLAVWPQASMGNLRAVETALRIIDKRADLAGEKAPIKHEVITVDEVDKALRELRERHPELARLDRSDLGAARGAGGVSEAAGAAGGADS